MATRSLFSENKAKNLLMNFACRRAHRIYFVGNFAKKQIEKSAARKFPDAKIIPVGVNTIFFKKGNTKSALPFPYIMTVGALKNRKGQHLSIAAFCKIASRYPDLKYVLVGNQGDSFYVKKLKKIVSDCEIENRVLFLSGISDDELLGYYNSALFFVMTSISTKKAIEGFGMVYMEAASCGKTAIGALDSGAEDAIEDGVSGILVSPEVDDIAKAMDKLISDKDLRAKLEAGAYERSKNFDWADISKMYLESFSKKND